VGQDHVVQALRNAILLGRVTHAYLFSGTRGVGKTSVARIFAKCLNCQSGPTVEPCNRCDICQAIAAGQDVDVIEIDGASNNGVEQVRELRQNASLRPSRARYKIYYIDEVHMLSTGAFNALLKTLEEPPEHVKFFFATTEPGKIPITVLSRCQRYDFAGIRPAEMAAALAAICQQEGVAADPAALALIARRGAGSLRDAQSLLEQLLSAGQPRLTEQLVYETLGLAPADTVLDLLEALARRDPAAALRILDRSIASGIQPADLLANLLDFFRDLMILAAEADVECLAAPTTARDRLQVIARSWNLDTVLAALQILAEARGRLRGSPHGRLLVELALCRVARLDQFEDLATLLHRLEGSPESSEPVSKKKRLNPPPPAPLSPSDAVATAPARLPGQPIPEPAPLPSDPPPPPVSNNFRDRPLTVETLREAWPAIAHALGTQGKHLLRLEPAAVAKPNTVRIGVPPTSRWVADLLANDPKLRANLEAAFAQVLGRPVALELDRGGQTRQPQPDPDQPESSASRTPARGRQTPVDTDPFVQEILNLFDARLIRLDPEDEPDLG
jgi:DNA polymerase-3 subunit gamma/tau